MLLTTKATNLVGLIDANGGGDVPVLDTDTRVYDVITRSLDSPGWTGINESTAVAISPDGRYVAFDSSATDLPIGTTGANPHQTFLFDRITRENTMVSHVPGFPTFGGDSYSGARLMTPDGRFVVFGSLASVFLYDRDSDGFELISRHAGQPTQAVGGFGSDLSADGRYLLLYDVYLYDRATNAATLISHPPGQPAATADRPSNAAWLSADGRRLVYVFFESRSGDLITQPTMIGDKIYRFDRLDGAVTRVLDNVITGCAEKGGLQPRRSHPGWPDGALDHGLRPAAGRHQLAGRRLRLRPAD